MPTLTIRAPVRAAAIRQAAADASQTALDRIATAADRVATAADRVQTGLDAAATDVDRLAAAGSAAAAEAAVDDALAAIDAAAAEVIASTAVSTAVSTIADRLAGAVTPTPVLEINMLDAEGGVEYVPNRQAADAVDVDNVSRGWVFGDLWELTGGLLQAATLHQTDAAGGKLGARLTASANGGLYRTPILLSAYTMSFKAKSLTGSSHAIAVGTLSGTRNNHTIGTTLTAVVEHLSLGGYPFVGAPAGNAIDVQIEDFRLEAGGSAGTVVPVAGHLYFGITDLTLVSPADAESEKALSGVTSGGASGRILLAEPISNANATILMCIRQTADVTGVAGLFGSGGGDYRTMTLAIQDGLFTAFRGTAMGGRHSVNLYGLGWVMVGARFDQDREEQATFIGDIEFECQPTTDPEVFTQSFRLGMLANGFPAPIEVGDVVMFDRVLSDTEIRHEFERLKAQMRIGPHALWDPQKVWIAEGDSRVGVSSTFVDQLTPDLIAQGILPVKAGFQGDGVTRLFERSARLDAMVKPGRRTYITLLIGPNDFSTVATSEYAGDADLYWGDIKRWIERRYQAGHNRIDICTSLPSSYPNFNTYRPALDALIRADEGRIFNKVIDLQASSMGSDAAGLDGTKYSDGTHPTTAGHAILAGIFQPFVEGAFRGRDAPMASDTSTQHPPVEP